ncbi:hypothetical protein AVEN_188913-1 [Araneus ventricosus]|uniref:Uncharacterized protein n=1 Tax=Araneus ventricosus TaxID=182803 RepID=A0A4Y2U3H7_ARAVE|nr:hypothetical protein AVEN_188913-1 [Araneus ventricosus]
MLTSNTAPDTVNQSHRIQEGRIKMIKSKLNTAAAAYTLSVSFAARSKVFGLAGFDMLSEAPHKPPAKLGSSGALFTKGAHHGKVPPATTYEA